MKTPRRTRRLVLVATAGLLLVLPVVLVASSLLTAIQSVEGA